MPRKESPPRGPASHTRREQIVAAAHQHIRQFGYEKATVGSIAESVGVSAAYVYKFFASKQAIANTVAGLRLEGIVRDVTEIVSSPLTAQERMRGIFQALAAHARDMALHEGRLYGLMTLAWRERWQAVEDYDLCFGQLIRRLVDEGRRAAEFERKTTAEEITGSILLSLEPLRNPAYWKQCAAELDAQAHSLTSLVLRSLTP